MRPVFQLHPNRGTIRNTAMCACAALVFDAHAVVDLNQFTPDSAIIGYSVYTTDSIWLPSGSGLANGGLFGSAGFIELGNDMKLRAPRINVGASFKLGANTVNPWGVPELYVGGNFTVGSGTVFNDTFQINGNFTAGSPDLTFLKAYAVKGNLDLGGSSLRDSGVIRLGGTYNAPSMTFAPSGAVEMSAASGGPAGHTTYNVPFANYIEPPLLPSSNLKLPASSIAGYAPTATRPDLNLTSQYGATDTRVDFVSGGNQTAYFAKCADFVPAVNCKGDTLQPGYYGALNLTGNSRALLITEGFYAFTSISISSKNALVAVQPKGGRTVVFSEGNVTASGSHAFIGPDSACLATGFGSKPGQFLGGTMMLASGSNITIPSDNRIWATLSAPLGDIHLSSQVVLFGQAYAKRLIGDNIIDFGEGAFISFKGLVPALLAPTAFTIKEKNDPACIDSLPCRDTTIVIRLPYTTAYTVRAKYSIVETSPRQAIVGKDFQHDTGTVLIAPGDTIFNLKVRIFDDSSYEGPETFRIVFDSLAGAGCPDANGNADTAIKSCSAIGTIVDDDRAPRLLVEADSTVHEGDAGTRPATFTVRLLDPFTGDPLASRNAPQVPVSFRWRTVDGTALASDADYVPVAARRDTLPMRDAAQDLRDTVMTISVDIRGDARFELHEYFRVVLDSLAWLDTVGSTLSDTGWILNDDSAPGVRIGDASVLESSSPDDTAWALFPVTLSRPSGLPTAIVVGYADSSARSTIDPVSGVPDYVAPSYTITIPADSLVDTLRIPVLCDSLYEKDESFKILLLSADSAVLDDSIGVGSIQDADSAPFISIDTAWVVEPVAGRRHIVFRTHLSRPSGLPVSVTIQVLPGTATLDLDYEVAQYTNTSYRAGLRDTTFAFEVLADSVAGEGTEDLVASITYHEGARAGVTSAKGYIVDAQGLPKISIADAPAVIEGNAASFRVTMDYATAKRATVRWSFVVGTADSADVKAYSGELVFEPGGSKEAAIAIPTVIDTVWEPTETFSVRLSDCDRCDIGDSTGLGTILEEGDVPRISFLGLDTSVVEDRAGTVRASIGLTRAASIPLSAALAIDPLSTATYDADWSLAFPANGVLEFAPGSRRLTMRLPVVPDTLEESTETVILSLSPSSPLVNGSKSSWKLSIVDDDHRPVVEITRPVDSLRTNVPGHVIEWTIDGTAQPAKDTTLVDGWNRIERVFVDSFGHVARDVHMVWGDFTPPQVHVFKIVGTNPLRPEVDTTWWGDRARTRFGVDTIWYWVRDSAIRNDGSWTVDVDTLVAVTNFSGDGLFPTEVKACDDLGNCGVDTGWIDLKQSIPDVKITTPADGQKVKPGLVPVEWRIVDGGRTIPKIDSQSMPRPGIHVVTRCWTDDVGNTGCDTTHPVVDTSDALWGKYVDFDRDGRIDAVVVTLDVPWMLDSLPAFDVALLDASRKGLRPDTASFLSDSVHLVVPVVPPFAWGVTGFGAPQTGATVQAWIAADGKTIVVADSFPIYDGAAPVIVDAEIRRVENYVDPDTLLIKPSEPVVLDPNELWIEVGSCPDRAAVCEAGEMLWHRVPAESLAVAPDGRVRVLVQPGDTGSVRPGYAVRFLEGVTDTLGNRVAIDASWTTVVHGGPRPELVKVEPPSRIPMINSIEQGRSAPGGILIRASRGNSKDGAWWEPGRGYVGDGDPRVQEICPDIAFCNGPTLYINRPVRMIVYIYDIAGTYTISRTIDITQADIDALQGDKIDRLYITPEWNHRSGEGKLVSTGVYVWRIIAQTRDGGQTSGLQNILWKAGVKVPRE